ncbi:MAG: hypothetical protein AAF386_14320 [Pseudomonadota bacterium]
MEQSRPILIYRIVVLALGLCVGLHVILVNGRWDEPGGPLRYLTIWALIASMVVAYRVLLISLGRSDRRFDGLVSATAVVNAMVVFLYWKLYFEDPMSVTREGELQIWWREYYLHGAGAALMWIDAFFINRVFRKPVAALVWLMGIVVGFLTFSELFTARFNDVPVGSVTSGLPYRFLNNLDFGGRLEFYATNVVVALVVLVVFTILAWLMRRLFGWR